MSKRSCQDRPIPQLRQRIVVHCPDEPGYNYYSCVVCEVRAKTGSLTLMVNWDGEEEGVEDMIVDPIWFIEGEEPIEGGDADGSDYEPDSDDGEMYIQPAKKAKSSAVQHSQTLQASDEELWSAAYEVPQPGLSQEIKDALINAGEKVYLNVPPGKAARDDALSYGAKYNSSLQAMWGAGDSLETLLDEYQILDLTKNVVHLNVSFHEKDVAKENYPIRWDAKQKTWYIHQQNVPLLRGRYLEGYSPAADDQPRPPYIRRDLVFFNVDFSKKDLAKSLGARWDPSAYRWCAKRGSPADAKLRASFDVTPDPKLKLDRAPTNASTCKFCKVKIAKGRLRVSIDAPDSGWESDGGGVADENCWGAGYTHIECSYIESPSWITCRQYAGAEVGAAVDEAVRRSGGGN